MEIDKNINNNTDHSLPSGRAGVGIASSPSGEVGRGVVWRMLFAFLRLLSRLPLRVHYFLSDWLVYPVAYYVVRYRRRLVKQQLADSFPERTERERRDIERRFYHFFCDYIVETLKLLTMPHEEVRRRVEFVGIPEMQERLRREGRRFGFFYLGHYGNWEWLASFPLWLDPEWQGAQIYHPLYNKEVDRFFIDLRQQFGGLCIPMKQTLRQILTARRQGQGEIIGFIADQAPKWEAMHHWTQFLHRTTSFFIGTEKIASQVDAALYYVRVTRPRRGYYRAELVPIEQSERLKAKDEGEKSLALSSSPLALPPSPYPATDRYAQLLEQQIKEHPELWLWTHNRWKRTYEEWCTKRVTATSRPTHSGSLG